ncbi:MAG: DUF4358 domain-containing protein [Wujia sp.]
MKKRIYGTILMVAMMGLLVGCGKDNKDTTSTTENVTEDNSGNASSDNADKELASVQAMADNILAGGDFSDKLEQMDKSIVLTRLYNLDESKIEDAAFYTSAGATSEEVAVIKVADEDYVETVVEACNTRINEQIASFKDYVPDEVPKLEAAVIYTGGNYVVVCVSCDSAKATTIIEEQFK